MQGHAGANILPVIASNRIGREPGRKGTHLDFYGTSFIAGPTGEIVRDADRETETVLTASFDLDEIRNLRQGWGIYRDRRTDLYGPLLTMDGANPRP